MRARRANTVRRARFRDVFKKVFVLSPHIDGRLYLAVWTIAADGTIVGEIPELPTIEMPYDEALHQWASAVEDALEPRRMEA